MTPPLVSIRIINIYLKILIHLKKVKIVIEIIFLIIYITLTPVNLVPKIVC